MAAELLPTKKLVSSASIQQQNMSNSPAPGCCSWQGLYPTIRERSQLLHPSVEHGEQDLHPGVHRPPQEVRRVHPRRGVPPHQMLHRQRRSRRAHQGLRMTGTCGAVCWTRAGPRPIVEIRNQERAGVRFLSSQTVSGGPATGKSLSLLHAFLLGAEVLLSVRQRNRSRKENQNLLDRAASPDFCSELISGRFFMEFGSAVKLVQVERRVGFGSRGCHGPLPDVTEGG